ncbi:MAG TPA: GMC family oxidoreductase [Xanthobacteraceae bacterium]|nr:GMC family oxidoreductase [Xanthobacteraceae bacterium]
MGEEKCIDVDAAIVGSGIAGALIAKQLGLAGKKVLILEAGAATPPNINGYMDRFLQAGAKVPESPYTPELFTGDGLTDPGTVNAGRPTVLSLGPKGQFGDWQDPKQSYLIQQGPLPFASTYERINGGTVRHWLGTSLRFLPSDFEMESRYRLQSKPGLQGFADWPLTYADLEPWYGKAEAEIGVSADAGDQQYLGIEFPPDYAYPMPGIPLSLVDQAVARAMPNLKVFGVGMDDVKWAVASTPAGRNSQPYQSRRVCAGNTNCIPICPIGAKYDPSVTLAAALRTQNVQVLYNAVATQVAVDEHGKVSRIDYVRYERDDGPATEKGCVTAKVYILAGHAIETPKLLLMSTSERTPAGVANGADLVGRYLMDHPLYLAWALMPDPVWGYRGPLSTAGIEICRDGAFRSERGAFRIEIGNEGWSFPITDPYTTTLDMINGMNASKLNPGRQALHGRNLVKELNDKLSRQFRLAFLVEQSPDRENRVTLSDKFTDHLGLPRPQIEYDLSDYTKKGLAAAKVTADAIFASLNAVQFTGEPAKDVPTSFEWPMGEVTRLQYFGAGHVVGTYRMGKSKDDSVVNADQRSWEHDNLYLAGSGTFPTVATGNPTLTIAALCLRTARAILMNDLK